jgi:hypothetical protein
LMTLLANFSKIANIWDDRNEPDCEYVPVRVLG